MSFYTVALISTWIVLVLLGLALAGVIRQIHIMQGGSLSDIVHRGVSIGATVISTSELGFKQDKVVLIFADTECSRCALLLEESTRWTKRSGHIPIVVVFRHERHNTLLTENGFRVLEHAEDLFNLFKVPVVPYAVTIDHEGVVRDVAPVGSADGLIALLERARVSERAT